MTTVLENKYKFCLVYIGKYARNILNIMTFCRMLNIYYKFIFYDHVGDKEIIKQSILNTNEMIELWRMTSYKSESGLEPYYRYYKSYMFNDELQRVKYSICDQYSTFHVSIIVLTIFNIPSYLCNTTNKKICF